MNTEQVSQKVLVIECADCGAKLAEYKETESRPEVRHTCKAQARRNTRRR